MRQGLDASTKCATQAKCLKSAGYEFVCRYYARNTKKAIGLAEARALSAAGLNIVVIWEDVPTSTAYFSHSRGVDDATSAYHAAMLLGQPAESPIYFAVDYDAPPDAIAGAIADYFKGVDDGFKAIAMGSSVHPIGVYGSGATCSWLLKRGMATFSWLAQSTKWSGHDTFSEWNIKQGPGKPLSKCGGLSIDTDQAQESYGGFAISAMTS